MNFYHLQQLFSFYFSHYCMQILTKRGALKTAVFKNSLQKISGEKVDM